MTIPDMVKIKPEDCCGCMSCIAVCPVDAISAAHDRHGNDYALFDTGKCIGCNKCDKVCPIIGPLDFRMPEKVYAAAALDVKTTQNASSGGVAYLLAKHIIEDRGIVYGCACSSLSKVEHIEVSSLDGIEALSGSKYVKSDISQVFSNIRKKLATGRKVLFIGTPCQVAAVKRFVGDNDNFFCVDLVCHGVPSISFLQRYAHEILGTLYDDRIAITFRKKRPQVIFGTWFEASSDRAFIVSEPYPKSSYMAAFFAGVSYRENCHNCRFAKKERISDITLGDFWGLKSETFDEQCGVSLVMCNTDQGIHLFEYIKDSLMYESHTVEEAARGNANLRSPFKRPDNKDDFYNSLEENTIKQAVKKTLPTYRLANNLFFQLYLKLATLLHKLLKRQ